LRSPAQHETRASLASVVAAGATVLGAQAVQRGGGPQAGDEPKSSAQEVQRGEARVVEWLHGVGWPRRIDGAAVDQAVGAESEEDAGVCRAGAAGRQCGSGYGGAVRDLQGVGWPRNIDGVAVDRAVEAASEEDVEASRAGAAGREFGSGDGAAVLDPIGSAGGGEAVPCISAACAWGGEAGPCAGDAPGAQGSHGSASVTALPSADATSDGYEGKHSPLSSSSRSSRQERPLSTVAACEQWASVGSHWAGHRTRSSTGHGSLCASATRVRRRSEGSVQQADDGGALATSAPAERPYAAWGAPWLARFNSVGVGPLPRCYGWIVGPDGKRIRVRVLWDSGATHNFLSAGVAAALGLSIRTGGPSHLQGVGTTLVACDGVSDVHLQLPTVGSAPSWACNLPAVVADVEVADVVLGVGFHAWYGVVLEAPDRHVFEYAVLRHANAVQIALTAERYTQGSCASAFMAVRNEIRSISARAAAEACTAGAELLVIDVQDAVQAALFAADGGALPTTGHQWDQPQASGRVDPAKVAEAVEAARAAEQRGEAYPGAAALTEQLANEFADVFAAPTGLPPQRAFDHEIDVEGRAVPRPRRVQRFSLAELETIREWVDDMLRRGWLQPSRSPWGAPVLCVRKPGGGLRVVQDMRALNSVTKKSATPLPLFDNMVMAMSGCKVFSTMDLTSFYFQIRLREKDRELTAISTPFGSYEFTVMAMGLQGAPATALLVMQDILKDHIGVDCGVFIDDIIAHTVDVASHGALLRELLTTLREHSLHISLSKCHFLRQEVKFLGHRVGIDGVKADPQRCAAIAEWPVPKNVRQLRSFLGLASYYRRFVEGFADIAAPLTELLKADSRFGKDANVWEAQHQAAFEHLRVALTSPPVLRVFNPHLTCWVRTDASDRAMGAVLYQDYGEDGKRDLRPVEFRSKKLSPTQSRYSAHEREFLAVLYAFEQFRCYLSHQEFVLETDNSALAYIKTSKDVCPKYARWLEQFEAYPCTIQHRAGRKMTQDADPLSRREASGEESEFEPDNAAGAWTFVMSAAGPSAAVPPLPASRPSGVFRRRASWAGPAPRGERSGGRRRRSIGACAAPRAEALRREVDHLMSDLAAQGTLAWMRAAQLGASRVGAFLGGVEDPAEEWTDDVGDVWGDDAPSRGAASKGALGAWWTAGVAGARSVGVPGRGEASEGAQTAEMADGAEDSWGDHAPSRGEASEGAADRARLCAAQQQAIARWVHPSAHEWPAAYAADAVFQRLWNNGKGTSDRKYRVEQGLLYRVEERQGRRRRPWEKRGGEFWRLCVPLVGTARQDYLHELHSTPLAGHRGKNATVRRARCLYWPKMRDDIEAFVRTCAECQRAKVLREKPAGEARPLPVPKRPWDVMSMDWITGLPPDAEGHDAILVIICQLTALVHLVAVRQTDDATDTAETVLQHVVRLHGVPETIVSDRDPRFTSVFWRSLCFRLGTRLAMSTAFHPQSDGKTERVNCVLEEMLRCYVDVRQQDWSEMLPMAEFAINSAPSESLEGLSPFVATYGYEPRTPWLVAQPPEALEDPGSNVWSERLQHIHIFCRDALQRAKDKQARRLNKFRRCDVRYKVGDRVLLSTKHLQLKLPGYKLTARYLGPFEVKEIPGNNPNVVRLHLPDAPMELRQHPVFNVEQVRPYYKRPERLALAKAIAPLHGTRWLIDGVVARRRRKFTDATEYLVVWHGFGLEQATWEPADAVPVWAQRMFDNRYPAAGGVHVSDDDAMSADDAESGDDLAPQVVRRGPGRPRGSRARGGRSVGARSEAGPPLRGGPAHSVRGAQSERAGPARRGPGRPPKGSRVAVRRSERVAT